MPAIAAIIPAITALTALSGAAKQATDQAQKKGSGDGDEAEPADKASNILMDSQAMRLKSMFDGMAGKAGGGQQDGDGPSSGGIRA